MPLTKEDLEMIDGVLTRSLDRLVTEYIEPGFRDLAQRTTVLEKTVGVMGESIVKLATEVREGFRETNARLSALETRLSALEERVGLIEDRLGRLSRDITRGRTSDSERIAALEARVAELEAKLEGKH